MNLKTKIIIISLIWISIFLFLFFVFSGRIVLPQYFYLKGFRLHYYGLFIGLAVGSAIFFARQRFRSYLNENDFENATLFIVILGFLSARLYHVVSQYYLYTADPSSVFKIWNGGLSIYGALGGGFLAIVLLKKYFKPVKQISLLKILDLCVPAVLLGQIIGRFGNLFNYEAYGTPTNLLWKMYVPEEFRVERFLGMSFYHPVFLYEVTFNFIFLTILILVERKKPKHGYLFFLYLIMYNSIRIFLEFLRIDSVIWSGFRVNAVISAIIVSVSLYIVFIYYGKSNKTINP